jgi:hypothetical protein
MPIQGFWFELSTMTRKFTHFSFALLFISLCGTGAVAKPLHHYVFFGMDREKIKEAKSFLDTKAFEGAQVAYAWSQLEPGKDEYDFGSIRADLAFLTAHHKQLWIQIQDVSFGEKYIFVPRYLLRDPQYHGGADRQYHYQEGDEAHETPAGWMARRWDPAVQERFQKLLFALGKEFDGRIEGINLAETSCEVGETGRLFPKGFTFEIYRDGIIANLKALKRAFPKSVALQYANFMPGEWANSKGYLGAVYKAAQDAQVGVGGPDLLPYQPPHMNNSYRLIKDKAGIVPVGIAVQDGNYEHVNPQTKKRVTTAELIAFATDYLKVDYIFWCTQEPFFANEVVPFLSRVDGPKALE